MMRTIHLHGRLKKKFGASFTFNVRTAAEALRALNCAFPGEFVKALQEGSFKLVRGDKRNGTHLDLDLVCNFNLGMADLHLIPAAAGAGNGKGVAKTIIGAALVGTAIFMSGGTLAAPLAGMSTTAFSVGGLGFTWGNMALFGLGLTLAGISTVMSKADNTDQSKSTSYSIGGATKNAEQGAAIPVFYGEVFMEGLTVSYDANVEDVGAYIGVVDPAFDSLLAGITATSSATSNPYLPAAQSLLPPP